MNHTQQNIFGRYGFFGSVRLFRSLAYTRLWHPEARLIRLPFDLRNRKSVDLGRQLTTGFGCRLEAFPVQDTSEKCLVLGDHIEMNDYVHIAAGEKVVIGNRVLIASKVFISDINHGQYKGPQSDNPQTPPNERRLSTSPVYIEDHVWIGESVCIMPGVRIGFGSVIGAGAVVTKDIPARSVAVGNPAKVIKYFNPDRQEWVAL